MEKEKPYLHFFVSEYIVKKHYTFFLNKNQVYKNVKAEILPKIKNVLRTSPASKFQINYFEYPIFRLKRQVSWFEHGLNNIEQ